MFNNIWLSVGSRILLNLFSMSHIPVYDIKLDWKYVHTICCTSSTHWCELWLPFCRRHFQFMRILQFYSNFVAAGTQRSIRQQQFCVLLGINLNYLIHFNVILSISTDSIGLNTQESPGIVVCRYSKMIAITANWWCDVTQFALLNTHNCGFISEIICIHLSYIEWDILNLV